MHADQHHLATELGPVDFEVIRQRLIAIPNQIEKNVERTAFSLLVREYKDYAVGLVDAQGGLICQSRYSLPAFVANALGLAANEALRVYGQDDLHSGDVVIVNGYPLGKHMNDVAAVTPVRIDGALFGFFVVLVHWVDVGASTLGSLSQTTTDVWQEGIQFPAVKLFSKGERVEEMFRLITANTRLPNMLLGDLSAQLGACFAGHDMVQEVLTEYGRGKVEATIDGMRRDAAAAARRAIDAMIPGEYEAHAFLDDDGIHSGVRIPLNLKVRVGNGALTVDYFDIGDQVSGPFNIGRVGGPLAFARLAAKVLLSPGTPVNEGDFESVSIEIPDGKFLSASRSAAVQFGSLCSPTVVDTILRALAKAAPSRVPAAHHGIYGLHFVSGADRDTGVPFYSIDASAGGWGAFPHADGASALRSIAHGDVRDVPVEIQEATYPYRIDAKRLRPDSGGAGRFRGGLGVEKIYSFPWDASLKLDVNLERTACAPWGLDGGHAGAVADAELNDESGTVTVMRKSNATLKPGHVLRMRSGGGGGHGHPWQRSVDAVAEDLREGYVSPAAAESLYGVVCCPDGTVNLPATEAARKLLAAAS